MIKLPEEQRGHQLPELPEPVTAQDMKESLNIPMFQEEAECAASAFNQCLMECQPVYDAAKRIKGALDECLKEMDSMQESINYKYKTLIKWKNRSIELEAEVQRLNATSQPVSDGCKWSYDDDGFWESACGSSWVFNDGGPIENECNFCQKCGGKVMLPTAPELKIKTSSSILLREKLKEPLQRQFKPICDHNWISSEGRTMSGCVCSKCGDYGGPEGL